MYRIVFALVGLFLCSNIAIAKQFGPLKGQIYGNGTKSIVVLLHGDVSRGGPANYHYKIANQIAAQNGSATVIALLRPGYYDGKGKTSPGYNNNRRDQYTYENNKLVAQTLFSIKKAFPNRKLIVVGHSGGAAQLGSVIGQQPGLVNTAVLLSCPCHLDNWHDGHPNWNPNWTKSQSPHWYIKKLSPKTRIIAITGANDKNTFPSLALNYVKAAKQRGINAQSIIVPGGNHNGNDALITGLFRVLKSEAG